MTIPPDITDINTTIYCYDIYTKKMMLGEKKKISKYSVR